MFKASFKICASCITGVYIFNVLLHPELKSLEGSIINTINLIFHEAGHWMFFVGGNTISIFMGSGTEVLIPLVCAIHLYITDQKYSSFFILYWLTTSLTDVSVYINDSIEMKIPLLGGDSVIHDWNYLLTTYNLLSYTHTISNLVFLLAYTAFVSALIGTLYYSVKELMSIVIPSNKSPFF